MYIRSDAVVLKRRNFGEADRIVTLFTKDHGKVVALAKGIRRPRSKKAGHLEIGNWCKVFVAKGKNLDLITEVELKSAFGIEDFEATKANQIYHLLEIVENLTPENQRNQTVFNMLLFFLNRIVKGDTFNVLSLAFKVKLLNNLGFFGTTTLKDSGVKRLLAILEKERFETIQSEINLTKDAYLKLSAFLDSIIEEVSQTRLKTTRFL